MMGENLGKQARLAHNKARHRVVLRLYREAMDNPDAVEDDDQSASSTAESLSKELLAAVVANRKQILAECEKCLDDDWRWSRLALLVRLILQSGATELLVLKGSEPKGRVISAYVNIARRYLEPPQVKFVNAVLDRLANE